MYARVATFEGGDVERLQQVNRERMASDTANLPAGLTRALVLQGDNRRLFVTFFDTREALDAAQQRFEEMGDEVPEEIRGRRVSVDAYEVVFDEAP